MLGSSDQSPLNMRAYLLVSLGVPEKVNEQRIYTVYMGLFPIKKRKEVKHIWYHDGLNNSQADMKGPF